MGTSRSRLRACVAVAAIVSAAPLSLLGFPQSTRRAGQSLDLAQPIDSDLREGDAQAYRIALAAGQCAEVELAQHGIDALLKLIDPDGRVVVDVDRSAGTQGRERLEWIAETAGLYSVEVTPARDTTPAGRYEIRLAAVRSPTPEDRERIAAQAAFADGRRLAAQNNRPAFEAAIEKFEAALLMFRAVSDREEQAATLAAMARVRSSFGDERRVIDDATRAVALFHDAGDRFHEGLSLLQIGEARRFLGDLHAALDEYQRALLLLRETGDPLPEGMALADIGEVHFVLHDLQQALEYDLRALTLLRRIAPKPDVAALLNNFGAVYRNLGEPEKAITYYQEALPLARAAKDTNLEATILNNIGVAYLNVSEPAKALDVFEQALPLRRALGNTRGEALSLDYIGAAYEHLGQPARTLEYSMQALAVLETLGDTYKQAMVLNTVGRAQYSLGDRQHALERYRRALALFEAAGDPSEQANSLRNIATIERDDGRLADARGHIERAVGLLDSIRAHAGNPEQRSSYVAMMTDHYDFYVDLLMRMHNGDPGAGHDLEAFQLSEHARGRSLLETLAESYADIRQGVDGELVGREHDLGTQLTAALDGLTKLLTGKHTAEQQAAAEKSVASLTDQYRQVQADIRSRSPRYAALTQPEPLTAAAIQQNVLDADTLLLEYRLGTPASYLWAVSKHDVHSAALPARAEIEARARRVYELLTARQPRHGETIAEQRDRQKRADAQLAGESAALSEILLGPIAADLGTKRLIIVSDGALQYLPFAALPLPKAAPGHSGRAGTSLLAEHEMISVPSASVLAVMRRELAGRPPAPKSIAVFADPVFSRDDARVGLNSPHRKNDTHTDIALTPPAEAESPLDRAVQSARGETETTSLGRLLFSRDEANAVLAAASGAGVLKAFDFRANRDVVTSGELSQYRVIHFATHGLLDSRQPDLSGLVLSLVDESGRPRDGFLRLHEIYNLKLNADLVVLSACQTALGRDVRGEGLIGLTRGFMYAGARRVMASLWQVDDAATSQLMKAFYRGMMKDGLTPAAALRAAQIEIAARPQWQSPYYWAAFVLQGEWQ